MSRPLPPTGLQSREVRPLSYAEPDDKQPRRQPTTKAPATHDPERVHEQSGPECPQCGGPTVWIGACYRCLRCGFKSACGQD